MNQRTRDQRTRDQQTVETGLPEAVAAERSLVGLWCEDWQPDAASLSPDAFYDPRWKAVAVCAHALAARGVPVNLETLHDELRARELIGDGKPLSSIADVSACANHLALNETGASLAARVDDAWQRRRTIEAAGALTLAAYRDHAATWQTSRDQVLRTLAPAAPPTAQAPTSLSGAEPTTARAWPKRMDDAAYYGVLGIIARDIEPFIEADSAALLLTLLTTAGTAMGRSPHLYAGAAIHRAILYCNVVGESGDNKSDSLWPVLSILEELTAQAEEDGVPLAPTRANGLSTGEGLLQQIRDERREERQKSGGKLGEVEDVIVDAGVKDKRLLNVEMEFARLLAVMSREGNTLSAVLRDLYDGPSKTRSSPKGNPIIATGGHVGMIGHITPAELARKLHDVELFNGFANRFMWVLTHREKSQPNPPAYTAEHARKHAALLAPAIARARTTGTVTRHEQAASDWAEVYEILRSGIGPDGMPTRNGMAKEVCARAHVQVMRISLIFAALDGSTVITAAHQDAALAVWDYCEACAVYLFSRVSGDPIADVIQSALVERGPLTRTDISKLFSRHTESGAIQAALDTLIAEGRAQCRKEQTSGAPREVWEAITTPDEAAT